MRGGAIGNGAARPDDRSPEPLVELTHVLNMVAPRPAPGLSGLAGIGSIGSAAPGNVAGMLNSGGASLGKGKPPSVAAELLVSSALRMQWPVDRRKVGPGDAANTCRDAAAVLQEAAAQLLSCAAALDGGNVQVRELKPAASGSESKRRRTFGGPSPVRALSPTAAPAGATALGQAPAAGGPLASRGSPPVREVRFAGLRV